MFKKVRATLKLQVVVLLNLQSYLNPKNYLQAQVTALL